VNSLDVLHNPIFGFYLKTVGGVLGVAGVILAFLTFVLRRDVRSIWKTYLGWLIMAPSFLVCMALGRIGLVGLFTVLSLLGLKEFCRATGLYRDWTMTLVAYVGVLATAILCFVPDPHRPGALGWYGLFIVLPVFMVALILLVPILRNRVKGQIQAMSLTIIGFLYIGWMFGHLSFLATSRNAVGYLLYLVFAVALNDVAAFTFGKLFGRHPFRSEISPRKTWEGSLGALAVSMVLPWLLRFSFPQFGTLQLVLTGLIVGIGGQLGDLSISVIKRDVGIKDMGAAIPGHGGVLDRIDSLIYVAPLFFHMVRFFEGM
jgi:phosphatidate cytidylyltransferase